MACRTIVTMTSDIDTTLDSLDYVPGVSSLPEYDTYLLDMWGVMHDGSAPYDGVLETVAQLKAQNKRLVRLVILRNSSKRLSHTHRMLKKLGFNIDDFEQIITVAKLVGE